MTTKKTPTGLVPFDPDLAAEVGTLSVAQRVGASEIQEMLASGFELAAPLVTLEAGTGFRAVFEGLGGPVDVHDKATGEIKSLQTYQFRLKVGGTFRLLGSAGLVSRLPLSLAGQEVFVALKGQKEIGGGKRVNDFLVMAATPSK